MEFNYNSNHIEGNTLTYGQTELLLLFGKVAGEARMFDLEEMKASNVGLMMVKDLVAEGETFLTQTFIKQLHKTLLREDYTVYRNLPDGTVTSFVIHAGQYKTRPNSVITRYGDRFEYASPEETPALMADLVDWYNEENAKGVLSPSELAILFHTGSCFRAESSPAHPHFRLTTVKGFVATSFDCGLCRQVTLIFWCCLEYRLDCVWGVEVLCH